MSNYLPVIALSKTVSFSNTVIFVDASNLYHSIKQIGVNPSDIDYHTLFSLISHEDVPKVRFYTAPKRKEQGLEQRAKQQSFFDSLKKNPNLSIHFGKLQLVKNGENISFREKGVDVKIAVDLINLAEKKAYDTAILLSGDADLVPAIESVLEKGKKVINAYFYLSSGKELRDKSSSSFRITEETLKKCKK